MEIQGSNSDGEIQRSNSDGNPTIKHQKIQVVTIQEFSKLVEPLAGKTQPRNGDDQLGSKRRRSLIQGVPPHLRARQQQQQQSSKSSVYDPQMVSIGPYHHGKPELRVTEEFKYRSLDWFAKGDEGKKLQYYNVLLERIDDIRASYADITVVEKYDDKALALMMLLDGCFIINLMNSCTQKKTNRQQLDWLHSRDMIASIEILISDVFVLENQIPFQVIQLIMEEYHPDRVPAFQLVCDFLKETWMVSRSIEGGARQRYKEDPPIHLLEACWRSIVEAHKLKDPSKLERNMYTYEPLYHSVTDLKAKGIHFSRSPSYCVRDITFRSHALYGELKLPMQPVSSQSQIILSNLIAFEACPHSGSDVTLIVLSYVNFMKSLIETPDDVKELQTKLILTTSFPSHEQVVKVFREIDTFGYRDTGIFDEVKFRVDMHCKSRARTWIADLIHTRFENPWSAIAFFAALLLLTLTFLQTWFTIHPVN